MPFFVEKMTPGKALKSAMSKVSYAFCPKLNILQGSQKISKKLAVTIVPIFGSTLDPVSCKIVTM